jgi:DNA-binding phage protein
MQEATRLDTFIKANAIRPATLARTAYVSRQHLMRVRTGRGDPTRHVMVRLMMACTLILRRRVRMDELFDLTDAGL